MVSPGSLQWPTMNEEVVADNNAVHATVNLLLC